MAKVSVILSRWTRDQDMKHWVMVIESLESILNFWRQRIHHMMTCHTKMVVIMEICLPREMNVLKDFACYSPILIVKFTSQGTSISVMGILEMLVTLIIYGTYILAHFVMQLTILWLILSNKSDDQENGSNSWHKAWRTSLKFVFNK